MKLAPVFTLVIVFFTAGATAQQADPAQSLLSKMEGGQFEVSLYNTACYFALAGKPQLAFNFLQRELEDGYDNWQSMEKDEDLLSLHSDPRWQELMKMAKNNASGGKSSARFFDRKTFWETGQLETPYRPALSEEEKVAGLSKLWSEVKYNFVNFDLVPSLNLDSLYLTWLPKVKAAPSTYAYYLLLEEFGAKLKDGHTNVYFPAELTEARYARPLVRTRLVEDKVVVVGVYDSLLRRQGIAVGQEVLKVNGMAVKEYAMRDVIPYQSASTQQDRITRGYDYALLGGDIDTPIQLELRDAKGGVKAHTIHRVKPAIRSARLQVPPFEYRLLPGNIAYVALNTFGNDSCAKAFAAGYAEISKAKAIIFDVRNNGGGNSGVGWAILRYLMKEPMLVHTSYTRDYKPTYRAWGRPQPVSINRSTLGPDTDKPYGGQVIVLTSARTFSAAEDFAAAFKTMKRGLVIGEATGGSSGQPLFIKLPGNGSARICTKRDMLGDGSEFVGVGIQPDKVVAPTVKDLRNGVDTELQAAIAALK